MTGSFIDDLSDIPGLNNLDAGPKKSSKTSKARETFPCESCGGTGIYCGVRIHQQETKCFACGGKGYFFKSYKDRMAARDKRAQKKADALTAAKETFENEHPGLISDMTKLATWNNFVRSLLDQWRERGTLSDKQIAAAINQIEKAAARDAERAAKRAVEDAKAQVDTSKFRELFETAKANGIKRPSLWIGDLKISEAPAYGANAGALYVKCHGEYAGKIVGATFKGAYGADKDAILAELLAVATNPAEALRLKGKQTGKCCCCGRELTDPVSVAAGIGPICANNWGL